MNIIKLRDKVMPSDNNYSSLFNTYFKGKYAYWVHMKYVVSMDMVSKEDYIKYENNIDELLNMGNYIESSNIMDYIDYQETEMVNNINEYMMKNSYVADEDITLDELKRFRTWLANELLLSEDYFDELVSHMIRYYADGMMDSTITALINFGSSNFFVNDISANTCGCHQSSNLSSLYNTQGVLCEPISIYRKNIYKKMVEVFSDVNFWMQFPKEFISTFKGYIDNIVKVGLPLSKNNYEAYKDCSCTKQDTQNDNIDILNRLSISLEHIYNGNVNGHRNYIKDSLYKWASELYEQMEW